MVYVSKVHISLVKALLNWHCVVNEPTSPLKVFLVKVSLMFTNNIRFLEQLNFYVILRFLFSFTLYPALSRVGRGNQAYLSYRVRLKL